MVSQLSLLPSGLIGKHLDRRGIRPQNSIMDSIEVVAHQLIEHALAIHRNVINHEGMSADMSILNVQAMLNLVVGLEPGDQQSAYWKVIDRLGVMPLNRDSQRTIFTIISDVWLRIFPSGLHF